jgi:hypothetical protein
MRLSSIGSQLDFDGVPVLGVQGFLSCFVTQEEFSSFFSSLASLSVKNPPMARLSLLTYGT